MSNEDYVFLKVATRDEIPVGERLFLEINNEPIVIINLAGTFFAVGDVCTHDEGPLGDGEIDGYQIICPRHGARFDLRTGKALTLPAVVDIPVYPVRIEGNDVFIGIKRA
ncbi:non-heme iron oxygenase ferredoxin subunit [Thermanaerothrix sp. 4228-RoL]|uniref:Non-heme iron oxygenase ferredoxin subunit n=1 Tax=Thermanaerothrix solaris TaxID=3058434 RepID=A0ABU3NIZ7_9CHLR|nr:non-heme iron oxygenase ferredoxin subunit [Thermanaerothrix sp. 4228-RoL]MDT8896825.1 non-heme iron oxygenase ferredoxin subunit [Thermanaerothrix sp. 4228-RoL]